MDPLVMYGGTISKIILDLCGGTGSWSEPYRAAGYDVRVVTLPKDDVRLFIPPDNVYGILAATPCDEFSIAKHFHGKGKYKLFFSAKALKSIASLVGKIM